MSKYNLSELLTEVAGGRIGTLEISARDLVRKMDDLEDKGIRVDRYDGLSADGKTYIEFHVHPIRKYDEDYSFSIYDFKFGFDPMSEEYAENEYAFSIGGRPKALDSAETVLRGGNMGFEVKESINEDEFDEARQSAIESSQEAAGIKENMYIDDDEFEMEMGRSKKDSLKKEMAIHVDQLLDGNIDMNDFMNVVEDIMAELGLKEVMGVDRKGNKKPDTDGSDATKFKKAAMSEEDSIEEAQYAPEVVDRIEMARKALYDTNKFDSKEIEAYIKSLVRDFDKGDFEAYDDYEADDYVEDMNNYISDKALQEHFNRFK